MIDREKIINALNICLGHGKCKDCGYTNIGGGYSTMDCRKLMMQDALELLKEQEPKTVLSMAGRSVISAKVLSGFCPKCNHTLMYSMNKHFCGFCGQEVKWNE